MISGADATRLARPYAQAAFDYAQSHHQLEQWSGMLKMLALYIQQPTIAEILKNPQYDHQARAQIILALLESYAENAGRWTALPEQNFIKLLAVQQRLLVLPQIYQIFEQFRIAIEKTLHVKVVSAVPLTEENIQKMTASLTKQLGQKVVLDCEIDPALLGGFMAYAGDRVIDSSVRGQLEKLRDEIVI